MQLGIEERSQGLVFYIYLKFKDKKRFYFKRNTKVQKEKMIGC